MKMKQRRDYVAKLWVDILTVVKSMTVNVLTATTGTITSLTAPSAVVGTTSFSIGTIPIEAKPAGVTMTVNAQAGNDITVNCQFTDFNGNAYGAVGALQFYIADDADGKDIAATAPDGSFAAGTDGSLGVLLTGLVGLGVCEADGDLDVVITESGADTFYVVFVLPDGSIVVSGACTFT